MDFNFGDILSRAWKITWKHKILWIFGILAGCGARRGTNFGNSSSYNFNNGDFPSGLPLETLRGVYQFISESSWVTIALILLGILLLLGFFFAALNTVGRVGLVRGTAQAEAGTMPALGELFRGGWPFFWRSFLMWFLVGFPFVFTGLVVAVGLVVSFLVAIMGMANEREALTILGMIPVIIACACFIGLLGLVVSLIGQQAQNAIVLEDLGIVASLGRGWKIFRANLGAIVLMAIILAVIGFAAGILIALPLTLILVPTLFAFVFSLASSNGSPSFVPLIVAGIALIIYYPISLAANGLLMAFTQSAWTLTYMRLVQSPETPVIVTPTDA